MRIQFSKLAKMATLGLALALTFSCSSGDDNSGGGGGGGNGVPFNENSQVYKSDNTKYTGSGNIKIKIGGSCSIDNNDHYTDCDWDDIFNAGVVNNGVVALNLPRNFPPEYLRDYPDEEDKAAFEKSCPNYPWGLKIRQFETFLLMADNESLMGALEIHYSNDGQIGEEIQYWYFSRDAKIDCTLEGNYVFSINATEGWNKIYRLRNYADGKRTRTEYSTNNILPKEIKWYFK